MPLYRCIKTTSTNRMHFVGEEVIFPDTVTPDPAFWVPAASSAGSEGAATEDRGELARTLFSAMGDKKSLQLKNPDKVEAAFLRALDIARQQLEEAGIPAVQIVADKDVVSLWTATFNG